MSVRQALAFAWGRAVAVIWGGGIAFFLYVSLVQFGPGIEGRFFPVIEDYHLTQVETDPAGGFSFVPEFVKSRDCTYHGITWFAPDARGNLSRIQGRRDENANNPPETGPMGARTGVRQSLVPPADAKEISGIMFHECGFIWQTRTMVGPFPLKNGTVETPVNARSPRVSSPSASSRLSALDSF